MVYLSLAEDQQNPVKFVVSRQFVYIFNGAYFQKLARSAAIRPQTQPIVEALHE